MGALLGAAPGCGRTAQRSEEPGGREAPRAAAAAEPENEAGKAGEMRSRWPRQERAAACRPGAVLVAERAAAAGEGHAALPGRLLPGEFGRQWIRGSDGAFAVPQALRVQC